MRTNNSSCFWLKLVAFSAWLASQNALGQTDSQSGSPPFIEKLGTLDTDLVETTPVVFRDSLYRFEYIRDHYPTNRGKPTYFRFVDVENNRITPPFAGGWQLGSAIVDGDTMHVFGVDKWDGEKIAHFWSTDLENWQQDLAMELTGWGLFNTSVCRAGDRFILAMEVGRPAEVAGVAFTTRFAESKDLREWRMIPEPAVFSKERYTACPSIRFLNDWFYMTYLEARPGPNYETHIVRSKDLVHWESSPLNPVLRHTDDDQRIDNPRLTDAQQTLIRQAVNRNNSDMDFCEFKGVTYIYYSWGNQQGTEFLAHAIYRGTLDAFLQAWFPAR